jgi:hypothetical protein
VLSERILHQDDLVARLLLTLAVVDHVPSIAPFRDDNRCLRESWRMSPEGEFPGYGWSGPPIDSTVKGGSPRGWVGAARLSWGRPVEHIEEEFANAAH